MKRPQWLETTYARGILKGLQFKEVYQLTVPYAEIRHRRAVNRRARISRRVNR